MYVVLILMIVVYSVLCISYVLYLRLQSVSPKIKAKYRLKIKRIIMHKFIFLCF